MQRDKLIVEQATRTAQHLWRIRRNLTFVYDLEILRMGIPHPVTSERRNAC
jgi:hypothetical protein